ncbi:Fc.00g025310.m01.CDS01 [Cosmosporella sp. VM-42]
MSFGGNAFGSGGGGFGQRPANSGLFGSTSIAPAQEESVDEPTVVDPSDELKDSLKKQLFTSGSYSDFVIKCGGDRYMVHRAIVCPRSAFFEACCNGKFKEAQSKEIDLPDDDPLAVKMMVQYFYHLDYSSHPPTVANNPSRRPSKEQSQAKATTYSFGAGPASVPATAVGIVHHDMSKRSKKQIHKILAKDAAEAGNPKPPPSLSLHAKVYALGEKYDIQGLKAVAAEKFEEEVKDHWDTGDFLSAAQEVYTSTVEEDRLMRDIVVRVFDEHSNLLDKKSVQDVVKGLDLSFDLLMRLAKRSQISRKGF